MSEHKPNLDDNPDFEPDFLRQIPLPFGAERDAEAVAERGPGPDEDRTRELIEAAATHFESVYERHGLEGLDREEASLVRGIRRLEAEVDKAQQRVEVIATEEAPGDDPVSRSKRNFLKLSGGGLPFDLGNDASPVYQELTEIAKTVQGLKFTAQRRRFMLSVLRNVRHQIQTFGEVRLGKLEAEKELMGHIHARHVRPYIDEAENLTHAYALVLAVRSDGTLDREAVKAYRKKENKGDRNNIRGRWIATGFLDKGTNLSPSEKLTRLKRRIKAFADEGVRPVRRTG